MAEPPGAQAAGRRPAETVRAPPRQRRHGWGWAVVLAFQLLVGLYGGYFGAGIGILMLARSGTWALPTSTT